jgi:hypothetical protein
MTLERLHQVAVEHPRFKLSRTRQQVMRNLWVVAGSLCQWQINGELWIDGSFLTEKIDPPDIDFVVALSETFLNVATPEQLAIVNWLCEDNTQPAKTLLSCDSYAHYKQIPGDPGYGDYLVVDAHWKKHFGTSREHQPKGIAVIAIPGGCV